MPFSCSPQDASKKCQIRFDVDLADEDFSRDAERWFVNTDCKCSMSDTISGFCDGLVGMDENFKAVEAMKIVLDKSKCHTLDRYDMRAQKDSCGIGTKNEQWRFAVEKMFNVTHWPYI